MPKIDHPHRGLLLFLDEEYQKLNEAHYRAAPRNGDTPMGGGDWMDTFFRMEAIRGCMTSLRARKTVEEAIQDGETVSIISIRLWNQKREWQVHRWEKTAVEFLKGKIRIYQQRSKRPKNA